MNFQDYIISEQSLNDLTTSLKNLGYSDLKLISGKSIAVLTDKNRSDVINDLAQGLRGRYITKPSSVSSLGYVDYDNFKIYVKPKAKQGRLSAGIENEDIIENKIKQALLEKSPLIIKFVGNNSTFTVKDVVSVKGVGPFIAGGKKADLLLKTNFAKDIPISIKKDNADVWESADTYWSTTAKMLTDKYVKLDKVKLIKMPHGYYKIEPNISFPATDEEQSKVIFGTDIFNNGAVVIKTFNSDDFKLEENVLKIYVSYVIKKLEDVPADKEVYFLIRNDKSRSTKGFYPGLRILAVTANRLYKTVLKLNQR